MSAPALARHLERIGLDAHPFPVTPDASRYYLSSRMEVHLTELLHCIDSRRGFMLVTADIGLGKTTLTRRLIGLLKEQGNHVSLVFNSFLHGSDLLEAINRDFGVVIKGGIGEQLNALNDFLLSQFKQDHNAIIILDDAQNLSIESLDLLRQISNLETNEHKLVQILLVAQPEIMTTLSYPEIRQLKSRIALHIELLPYTYKESCCYVEFRLNSVGNSQHINLSKSAYRHLESASRGYPRQINLIMDRVLYGVAVQRKNRIDGRLVKQAVNEINGQQNQYSQAKRLPLYAVPSVFLILLFIGWNWTSTSSYLLSANVEAIQNNPLATTNIVSSGQLTPLTLPLKRIQRLDVAEPELHSKILLFLEHVDLTVMTDDLVEAIEQQHFEPLEQQLLSQGWSLLHFNNALEENLNTLKITDRSGNEEWLLLWLLPYPIPEFNFGTESEGVRQLQNELAALDIYTSKVDGVVGGLTLGAVAQFQQRVGLPPSGQLTSKTRYLLQTSIL